MTARRVFPKIRSTIGLAGCLLTASTVLAADGTDTLRNPPDTNTLTLDALVDSVLRENPELAFYRAEIAAAKAGRKTASEWSNPELNTDLGSKRVWERGGGSTLGDGLAWSVSVAQTFEWPGRIALRKAIANRQVTAAQLGLDQFQAALAARARSLGYAVLVAQEKANAANEVARRFRALLEVLVQRDSAGVTPLLDQRIIEATTITLNRRASQSEQELQSALVQLNQLRGRPAISPLSVTGTTALATNMPAMSALFDAAGTNNFEVRMRQLELEQQGFQVQLSKNERWPKVTLAPFYSSEKAADQERIVGVGIRLPLPLWNQNKGNIDASQARLQQAESSLQTTCRQVERQVVDHALALQTKLEEMARWRPDAAQQFREAAELADRHYRLGAVPITTYVEMQTRYLDALEALLATRGEALAHQQQLELLTGQKLVVPSNR
jgi:cobalt-zinc-cadmium efflux system outer membrane protein